MTYLSKSLFIDTREKKNELERIEPKLNELGYETIHSKLWVGDYQLIHNTAIVVDRKKDLNELIGNVTQQHERFRNECVRAQAHGIKLIILCEHGHGIRTLDDLDRWKNPRIKYSKRATTGKTLKKILETMTMLYDVEFLFCDKEETPKKIIELLEGGAGCG